MCFLPSQGSGYSKEKRRQALGVFGTRGFICLKPRPPVGGDKLERAGLGERKALALREAGVWSDDGAWTR